MVETLCITPRKLTVIVKNRVVEFETRYTNEQAWMKAKAFAGKNSFLDDLVAKGIKYRKLSPSQWNWLIKLVQDIENPPARPAGIDESLMGVIELFDRAAETLKHPTITFDFDGKVIELKRTSGGKYPGAVYITDGGGYGRSVWYGRVERDGTLTPSFNITDEIRTICKLLSTDPVKIATEYGLKSGNCCFCGKKLTDERSTDVGYGLVCSKKWGLPYGKSVRLAE